MTKRLIDLDDDLLDTARESLGTSGITDTVRRALHDAIAAQARSRQIAWLDSGGMTSLADPAARDTVWH